MTCWQQVGPGLYFSRSLEELYIKNAGRGKLFWDNGGTFLLHQKTEGTRPLSLDQPQQQGRPDECLYNQQATPPLPNHHSPQKETSKVQRMYSSVHENVHNTVCSVESESEGILGAVGVGKNVLTPIPI
jgi:hypothetical protein